MTPENIQIVRYRPDDHRPLLHFLIGIQLGNRASAENLMYCLLSDNVSVLVAKLENNIVGYSETHGNGRDSVYFHRAAVHRSHRRKGIFTGLLDEVVRRAGRAEITAEVSRDAKHLRAMQRVGFEIAKPLDGYRYQLVRPRQKLFSGWWGA
ncbi:GNAT family N-acetyltransferase [Patescibacteria group bacterium]|nr:GNAT family N-acetyltransferase [Patescibacteria group bacterium]